MAADKPKFTKREAEALLDMGRRMVGLPLYKYLREYIDADYKAGLLTTADRTKAMGVIEKINPPTFVGSMAITFKAEDVEYTLRYKLDLVNKDYETDVQVPPHDDQQKLIGGIFFHMDKMADLARQYYVEFIGKAGKPLTDIYHNRDISMMSINQHNRVVYLPSPNHAGAIGVTMAYD